MTTNLTANQLVGYNLRRARELRAVTQEEAGKRLEPYLGRAWTKASVSAAERSIDGERIREFTADEIVAFAQAFDLPISWFFLPLPDELASIGAPGAKRGRRLSPGALLDLVFGPGDRTIVDRLIELFGREGGDVPSHLLTPAILAAAEHSNQIGRSLLERAIGSPKEWADRLRDLAAKLEGVEDAVTRETVTLPTLAQLEREPERIAEFDEVLERTKAPGRGRRGE